MGCRNLLEPATLHILPVNKLRGTHSYREG
jgi:hypothetical protein